MIMYRKLDSRPLKAETREQFHLGDPVVGLVLKARQMQQSVASEQRDLGFQRPLSLRRLLRCRLDGDHDISQYLGVLLWKRKDVGGAIFAPVLAVKLSDSGVAGQEQTHFGFGGEANCA